MLLVIFCIALLSLYFATLSALLLIEFTLGNIINVTALLSSHFATLSALLHYLVHTSQHYQRYCIIEFALGNIISVTA